MTVASLTNLLVSPSFLFGVLLAAVIALLAFGLRWLSVSGAVTTCVMGAVIFGLGGWKFAIPLLTFFVTSSLLSKIGRERKAAANAQEARGSTRDGWQVLANGGIAAALVLFYVFYSSRYWPAYERRIVLMLYLAALAAVNADTWATELGKLFGGKPRLLTNWRRVEPGTSGAISFAGVLASAAGALLIPLSALWLWKLHPAEFFAVAWAGFLGSFLDSLLGAGLQAKYRDPTSGELTEHPEIAGRDTTKVTGLHWLNNDGVNFLASAGSVLFAWLPLHYYVYPYLY